MKKTKHVLCALLAIVMALSITACGGSKSGKDGLVGVWSWDLDMSGQMADMMSAMFGDDFDDFDATLIIPVRFEFKNDGTYSFYGDREAFTKNLDNLMDSFVGFFSDLMYDMLAEMGISKADADAQFEAEYGASIEEYSRQMLGEAMDVDELLEEIAVSGKYETSDNKLYISVSLNEEVNKSDYMMFTITGNTLKLEAPEGSADEVMEMFGNSIELTRVS